MIFLYLVNAFFFCCFLLDEKGVNKVSSYKYLLAANSIKLEACMLHHNVLQEKSPINKKSNIFNLHHSLGIFNRWQTDNIFFFPRKML